MVARGFNIFSILLKYAVDMLTWDQQDQLPAGLEPPTVCLRGFEGGLRRRPPRRPPAAQRPRLHEDRQICRPGALPGGEAAAKDSLREDHEADPQEGRHGDHR